MDPSSIVGSECDTGVRPPSCFGMPPLCKTTLYLALLGAQAIKRLDFLQWLGGFAYILQCPVESNTLQSSGLIGVHARCFSIKHNSCFRRSCGAETWFRSIVADEMPRTKPGCPQPIIAVLPSPQNGHRAAFRSNVVHRRIALPILVAGD